MALQVEGLVEDQDGLRVTLRRSKNDQAGAGQVVGISRTSSANCPVAALAAWQEAAAITAGPLFHAVVGTARLAPASPTKRWRWW